MQVFLFVVWCYHFHTFRDFDGQGVIIPAVFRGMETLYAVLLLFLTGLAFSRVIIGWVHPILGGCTYLLFCSSDIYCAGMATVTILALSLSIAAFGKKYEYGF